MNGLWAAALYLGTLFAVYGQRDAGFEKNEEKGLLMIVSRKNVSGATKKEKTDSISAMRKQRIRALMDAARTRKGDSADRYKDYAKFEETYAKATFAR